MEKDPESIATVQMKPEYAASEVYSTASEAPPAYKMRQSSSVQIAKIIAMTVIASSFIIGFFVLASAYLQAKASCDQMQTLDSVLEKELMLETLQDLPKAEALQAQSYKENSLQNDEKYSSPNGKEDPDAESVPTTSASDSESESDSNESGDINRLQIRLPLEFDLNDLTNALMEGNQKSRMNCVVERRRSEEFVDSPAKTMQLPFGLNISSDPKKQRITGERMAIFCESGTSQVNEEPSEPVRQVVMPIHAIPLNFAHQMPVNQPPPPPPQPQMHHMPPPQSLMREMPPPPPQNMPSQGPMPIHVVQAPRPYQPEVRIQLQRVQIPRELLGEGGQEQQVQIQRVPLDVALHRAGITAEDLQNIQRMAEERIQQELKEEMSGNNEEDDDSSESSEEEDSKMVPMQQVPVPAQFLQMGRIGYGRSLLQPVKIPVPMMQQENTDQPQQAQEEERPHFVQPRSVRSVDSVLHREKRVKRCACDCNC
uniref:Putative mediator of rna polymerase ii transcription subunit 26 isoform x2 n=1 Tax=Lutzomyia longipalpis TaxID=7200 RepID=A0A7G3AQ31_LUTLO